MSVSMTTYETMSLNLARAVGKQKALKAQRTSLNREISNCYKRFEKNGEQHNGKSLVPMVPAWDLPKLVSKLGKVERKILSNRSYICMLEFEIFQLKFKRQMERIEKFSKHYQAQGAALKVDDLKEVAEKYLTDKAKTALEKVVPLLSILRADSEGRGYVHAQAVYLGKRTPLSKVEDAVKFVAEKVNLLAEAGEIVSRLSHVIKFDLHKVDPDKEQECVVVIYVHVLEDVYKRIMANPKEYGSFSEGEIPE